MVQLTLLENSGTLGIREQVAALERDWAARIGSGAYLADAARITVDHLTTSDVHPGDAKERARVEAYFGAVARRRLTRSTDPDARSARRRLVMASIEADLRSAGWDARRAAEEARRATGAA